MVSILNLRIVKGSSIWIFEYQAHNFIDPVPLSRYGKIEGILRAPTYREIGVKIETTVSRISYKPNLFLVISNQGMPGGIPPFCTACTACTTGLLVPQVHLCHRFSVYFTVSYSSVILLVVEWNLIIGSIFSQLVIVEGRTRVSVVRPVLILSVLFPFILWHKEAPFCLVVGLYYP